MIELKAKVVSVEVQHVLDGNYDQQAVKFDIIETRTDEGVKIESVVATRIHGFPMDATQEQITEAIKKEIATYQSDKLVGEQSAKQEELQSKAAETAQQLSGKEIV